MKRKRYRAIVIGCGKIGALFEAEAKREKPASHAGAVTANKKTELAALVDTDAGNLAAAQKLFPRAVGYRSLTECLAAEQPDIAIIATPPRARLEPLKECARFRVPIVISEKPLAGSVREAIRMETLIEKSGMTFVLNYHRCFSPLFARARATIAKGKLGAIQQVTCYYSNGLYNNGGHTLDALQYLIDDVPVSVVAEPNFRNKTVPEGDANVDALLKTKKGTTIVLQSFDQNKYGIHDFRIYGSKGSIVITGYGTTLIETPARSSRFAGVKQLDNFHQSLMHVPLSATEGALGHAIECYEKHRTPSSAAANGIAVLRVLAAVAKSAKSRSKKIYV